MEEEVTIVGELQNFENPASLELSFALGGKYSMLLWVLLGVQKSKYHIGRFMKF
jgi:hypothetical protein